MRATWIRSAAMAAAAAVLALTPGVRGSGVDPRYIPADAKWVVHVDVDAVVKSKLWSMLSVDVDGIVAGKSFAVGIRPEGASKALAGKKVKAVAEALGMRLPEDIHGITLAGRSFDEEGVVMVVNATMDHDRLIGMAKLNPEYTSAKHAGVEVSSFEGDDGVSGAFLADDVLVLGQTAADVRRAIDTAAANKGKSADTLMSMLAGAQEPTSAENAGIMVYVAAEGLAALMDDEDLSPILKPVKSVRATIVEREQDVVLKATLNVKDGESAGQVRGALEGIRAIATLAALDEKQPENQILANLAARAVMSTDQTSVKVDWPVSLATLRDLAEKAGQKPAKKRRASTRPAATAPAQAE